MTTLAVPLVVGDRPLTIADVVRVAEGAEVILSGDALARIRAARDVVDELVNGDELIYGLNTGLGHMRDQRMPVEALRAYQDAIIVAHEGSIGEPLPVAVVRAAMLVRIAGLANGGSGASAGVAETLVAMLNRGVHPVVPAIGSVGASDLMHMTSIALVATGLGGRAVYEGETLAGPDAMRRAGLEPVRMEPRDGLALISANGVSIGQAALVAARAEHSADTADVVVSASLEAIRGNPSVVDPIVSQAKPIAGQAESAARIRRFLAGSDRCRPGGPASVQDPLSFRVAPQVHGAFREFGRSLAAAVETELASCDDNPLVSVAERRLISNGNFHPMVLALAADAVRPAAAHVGLISDRRMSHLWAAIWSDPALSNADGLATAADHGGVLLRYAAGARYTQLRALANPITLDVPPLDVGVEDHATNAPLAVLRTDESLDLLDDLLAIELLLAADAIDRSPSPGRLGDGVEAAFGELRAVQAQLGRRPPSDVLHATVRAALGPRITRAAEGAVAAGRPP